MKIKVGGGGGDFLQQPAPEGPFQAVCCDVVDEGQKTNKHGVTQLKLSLRFQSARLITLKDFEEQAIEPRDDAVGEPFLYTTWYTASLAPGAWLTRDLKGWGIDIPAEEGTEFDLDAEVIGRNALLTVKALPLQAGKKTPFIAIETIVPLPKFDPETGAPLTPITVSPNYTRVQDREQQDGSFDFGANKVPAGAE